MSQPFCRFLHPFDFARHPSLEPEVQRAILASWAPDRCALQHQLEWTKRPGVKRALPIEKVLAATHDLNTGPRSAQSLQ